MSRVLNILAPGYKPPVRQTIAKHMNERYLDHRQRLSKILAFISDIALTTDLWKHKNGSYFIVITAHFFDKKYNYYSMVISFKRFYNRHTSLNIKELIIEELNKLNILEKCVTIVTDSGSDVKSACKNLSKNCWYVSL